MWGKFRTCLLKWAKRRGKKLPFVGTGCNRPWVIPVFPVPRFHLHAAMLAPGDDRAPSWFAYTTPTWGRRLAIRTELAYARRLCRSRWAGFFSTALPSAGVILTFLEASLHVYCPLLVSWILGLNCRIDFCLTFFPEGTRAFQAIPVARLYMCKSEQPSAVQLYF